MQPATLEPCPGCGALLVPSDGPTHRYIGASAACWALFSALMNGGEPPVAPAPTNDLLGDAYAVQHPGTPSPQASQSVAVHALVLHGVLVRGVDPEQALWIRRQALREGSAGRHGRFQWLVPPAGCRWLSVADIVQAPTPQARAGLLERYVRQVWECWNAAHGSVIAAWYDQFVTPE